MAPQAAAVVTLAARPRRSRRRVLPRPCRWLRSPLAKLRQCCCRTRPRRPRLWLPRSVGIAAQRACPLCPLCSTHCPTTALARFTLPACATRARALQVLLAVSQWGNTRGDLWLQLQPALIATLFAAHLLVMVLAPRTYLRCRSWLLPLLRLAPIALVPSTSNVGVGFWVP